jgi:hypothetical protein
MNRRERRATKRTARKPKVRRFKVKPSDMFDVLLFGLEEHPGEVVAVASSAGRESLDKVFPNCAMAWRDVEIVAKGDLPDDWREFDFIVPSMLDIPNHKIPQRLLALKTLDDLSSDQFAHLMMEAVNDVGGRAAYWSFASNKLIQIQMKHQSQFVTH